MAYQHVETNPHFIDPEEKTPDQRHYLPAALLPRRGPDQRIPSHRPQDQRPQPRHYGDEGPQPLGPSPPEPHHEGQPYPPLHVWVPPVHHEDQSPQSQPQNSQGQQRQPLEMSTPPSSIQGLTPKTQKRQGRSGKKVKMPPQLQDQHPSAQLIRPLGEVTEHQPSPGVITPQPEGKHPHEQRPRTNLFLPRDRPTKPLTWFAAAFCIIFWLVIIIGGLIVLIVYLVFRPRSPHFDVNSVSLNAAYLDMRYLLNADLSVLANFTNPNMKVSVDFSYMYLDLYFENSMIATQYIEPFSAARGLSMIANIHMVTSQVRLSLKETLLLQKQIENNRVMFTVKGKFRARYNLGGFLKYSYWLHGHCSLMVSSPPNGVLRAKRCNTKH
ncbi:NDR1/HIN1-like protein 6 [Durio zibethinus]|uniref:NDR1/HIN1-like protein 6 n=1 Tax=Durio zibethinus TaxID=66656 RepID=A0A6P5X9A8_DURZI|nr:NDR1/HIN1-like protein 6 [Durio zibethinus]